MFLYFSKISFYIVLSNRILVEYVNIIIGSFHIKEKVDFSIIFNLRENKPIENKLKLMFWYSIKHLSENYQRLKFQLSVHLSVCPLHTQNLIKIENKLVRVCKTYDSY